MFAPVASLTLRDFVVGNGPEFFGFYLLVVSWFGVFVLFCYKTDRRIRLLWVLSCLTKLLMLSGPALYLVERLRVAAVVENSARIDPWRVSQESAEIAASSLFAITVSSLAIILQLWARLLVGERKT